jgi:hypothetical protein
LIQVSLALVHTLMLQEVLAEGKFDLGRGEITCYGTLIKLSHHALGEVNED